MGERRDSPSPGALFCCKAVESFTADKAAEIPPLKPSNNTIHIMKMKILLGLLVLYTLSATDVSAIESQREREKQCAEAIGVSYAPGNPVQAGEAYPAIVVRIFGDGSLTCPFNLKVLLDGPGNYWATSRHYDAEGAQGAFKFQGDIDNWAMQALKAPAPSDPKWLIVFTSAGHQSDEWETADGTLGEAISHATCSNRHLNYGRNGFRIVPNNIVHRQEPQINCG